MNDLETVACLVPWHPREGRVFAEARRRERKPWHWRNDACFDAARREDLEQPSLDEEPVHRLRSVREKRREDQDPHGMPSQASPSRVREASSISSAQSTAL